MKDFIGYGGLHRLYRSFDRTVEGFFMEGNGWLSKNVDHHG